MTLFEFLTEMQRERIIGFDQKSSEEQRNHIKNGLNFLKRRLFIIFSEMPRFNLSIDLANNENHFCDHFDYLFTEAEYEKLWLPIDSDLNTDYNQLLEEKTKLISLFWYAVSLYSNVTNDNKKTIEKIQTIIDKITNRNFSNSATRRQRISKIFEEHSCEFLDTIYCHLKSNNVCLYDIPSIYNMTPDQFEYLCSEYTTLKEMYESMQKALERYSAMNSKIVDRSINFLLNESDSSPILCDEEISLFKYLVELIPDYDTSLFDFLYREKWEVLTNEARITLLKYIEELYKTSSIHKYTNTHNPTELSEKIAILGLKLQDPIYYRITKRLTELQDLLNDKTLTQDTLSLCEEKLNEIQKMLKPTIVQKP